MNWERSKSILIVFFLLINICLCVILVRIRTSHSTLSKNTIQQVVKLLEQNQITIREDIIPPQKYKNINFHLTTLLFEKEKNLEKLYTKLKSVNVSEYKVIRMQQGTKSSRILAWRFATNS